MTFSTSLSTFPDWDGRNRTRTPSPVMCRSVPQKGTAQQLIRRGRWVDVSFLPLLTKWKVKSTRLACWPPGAGGRGVPGCGGTKVSRFTCPRSCFTPPFTPCPPACSPSHPPPPNQAPAHSAQASPGSPVTHLAGGEGALAEGPAPPGLLHQDGPRPAPPGSRQASREDSEDARGDPRAAPSWQPPSGTGARLQRPPAPGGGQGPLPAAEEKPRKTKMAPASGRDSTLGQAGRPAGPPPRGSQPNPGHARPLPAPSGPAPGRHVCFAGSAILLGGLWWTRMGTGLSPTFLPSCRQMGRKEQQQ